jgi:Ner family transcriptional regulator
MNTRAATRKRAADWHWADVKAALEKRGLTLTELAEMHGYATSSFTVVKGKAWPAAEKIIADAIGVDVSEIWPSRYR